MKNRQQAGKRVVPAQQASSNVLRGARNVLPAPEADTGSSSVASSPGFSRAAFVVLLLQVTWAVAIPIKNVIVMPYPNVTPNSRQTTTSPYNRDGPTIAQRNMSGHQVHQVVQDVVHLSLNKSELRVFFETKGDFVIDKLGGLLSPEEHQLFAQYYALVFQASEIPAGGFVQRSQQLYIPRQVGEEPLEFIDVTVQCTRHTALPGMRCENAAGMMCDDNDWHDPAQLKLTPVDLELMTRNTGWSNKISMMAFISAVHTGMRTLFSKAQLSDALATITSQMSIYAASSVEDILNGTLDDVLPAEMAAPATKDLRLFESCIGTEAVLARYYANIFAIRTIQDAARAYNVYNATAGAFVGPLYSFKKEWEQIFDNNVLLTTGAGAISFENYNQQFVTTTMTRNTTSVASLKLDRPMSGIMLMGNSLRNLEYLSRYPNSYYGYSNVSVEGDLVVADWRQLGAMYAGFDGFKPDATHNTMGVFRLAERRESEGTGYAVDWFDREQEIAKWYRSHEVSDPNSLIKMALDIWAEDSPAPYELSDHHFCMEGLFRKIAQTMWIMALKQQPVMSHLVFMSMDDLDPPATWFYRQMFVNEVVGENIGGIRISIPFAREGADPLPGSAWPLIPLMMAFKQQYGGQWLETALMQEMNTTFLNLVQVEDGRLNMQDAVHCWFGKETLHVSADDDKATVWSKLCDRIQVMIHATVARVDVIHNQLQTAFGDDVIIRHEYVSHNHTSALFQYEGPPVYWQHSALGVGLLRLSCLLGPLDIEMQPLRDSLVCYDTLETRFLNVSTRCWAEPGSIQESRMYVETEGLRQLEFSMWSLGVTLNVIAVAVSTGYAIRIWWLWHKYRLSDMSVTLALFMDFQGLSIISLDSVIVMAVSSIPLILMSHLPELGSYVDTSRQPYSSHSAMAEFMVLLSLTWFVQLGLEFGARCIHLHQPNWWFRLLTGRVRLAVLLCVLMMRQLLPRDNLSFNYGLVKLVLSCIASIALGGLSMAMSTRWDRKTNEKSDPLTIMLERCSLPRNRIAVLGQLGSQWFHAGMVMERWRVLRVDGSIYALTCGNFQIVPLHSGGRVITDEDLTPNVLRQTLLRKATAEMSQRKASAALATTAVALRPGQVPPNVPTPAYLAVESPYRWHWLSKFIIIVQVFWAVVIPMKNVVVMPYPNVIPNSLQTTTTSYHKDSAAIAPRNVSGPDVYQIVNDVVHLALNKSELRVFFENKGDFAIDEIGDLLTAEDHHLFARYYALVFQASDIAAAGFVPRTQQLYIPRVNEGMPGEYITITIQCTRHTALPGMRCENANGAMCDDNDWNDPSQLTLTPIDLETTTQNTGWHNKISTMSFISAVHSGMRTLFSTKHLDEALQPIIDEMWDYTASDVESILNDTDNEVVPGGLKDNNITLTRFESCYSTEAILSHYHANLFAIRLIQDAVLAYKAFDTTEKFYADPPYTFATEWGQIFSNNVLLTTGAGAVNFSDDNKRFITTTMTRNATSLMSLKLDRPMSGAMIMGNALRHLEYMWYYPNSYYGYCNVSIEGDLLVADWRQLGAMYAGFNGYTYDFTLNTMGVFRLAERRRSQGTGYANDWFDREREIAAWYRSHELNDPLSLIEMAESVWMEDSPTLHEGAFGHHFCLEGLYRKIAQTLWIMALETKPVMSHLVYMSMQDPDPPATWFFKQMSVNEVVGENIGGIRVVFPFARDGGDPLAGSAWVLIVLVRAFEQEFGAQWLESALMDKMNTTFLGLIDIENGRMMMKDAVQCQFGWTTLGVASGDDKSMVWDKLYARMHDMVRATIKRATAIHSQMQARFGADVVIRHEYASYNHTSSIFRYEGPPVYWQHTALGVGLMRLSSKLGPTEKELQPLRDSLVCYDTLETRFLNLSTRCWAEPNSVQELRSSIDTQGCRFLEFTMWSIGVILNLLGAVIALRFVKKILLMWKHNCMRTVPVKMAINLSIQGLGLISLNGIAVMSFGCLPLIVSYHLPITDAFVADHTSSMKDRRSNPVVVETMVLLSLTWFFRLGTELGSRCIPLHYYNWWFSTMSSRIRYVSMLLLLPVRLCWSFDTYNGGLAKLIVSVVTSMLLGFVTTLSAVFTDKPRATMLDPLSQALDRQGLARNQFGVVAQSGSNWS
ncbi:TPA: hypothetical protein N0F65_006129 [Lagenidium giganteum]|uniref:Uncharacterized protein n=1 Tax=Lagenidium giganteum TaxID=4803 RepID=A0AAV2Z6A8_9STRA|nr:TPA: hypothetical protein N0F65_006129 [Lagenidium giganteum]